MAEDKLYTVKISEGEIVFKNIVEDIVGKILANNIYIIGETDWKDDVIKIDYVKLTGFVDMEETFKPGLAPKGQFKVQLTSGEIFECWLGYRISTKKVIMNLTKENGETYFSLPVGESNRKYANRTSNLEDTKHDIVYQIYSLLTEQLEVLEYGLNDVGCDTENQHKVPNLRW